MSCVTRNHMHIVHIILLVNNVAFCSANFFSSFKTLSNPRRWTSVCLECHCEWKGGTNRSWVHCESRFTLVKNARSMDAKQRIKKTRL